LPLRKSNVNFEKTTQKQKADTQRICFF